GEGDQGSGAAKSTSEPSPKYKTGRGREAGGEVEDVRYDYRTDDLLASITKLFHKVFTRGEALAKVATLEGCFVRVSDHGARGEAG
ncbi:unnamed protein product, partial [Discosporangium mesarthrocarpum]